MFSHASRPPAMQGATLISNSIRTTPPLGTMRWEARVFSDEAKSPKPGSRNGTASFAKVVRIVAFRKN